MASAVPTTPSTSTASRSRRSTTRRTSPASRRRQGRPRSCIRTARRQSFYSQAQFLSSAGYGFLLDQPQLARFRLDSDRPDAWSVAVSAPSLTYVVAPGKPTTAIAASHETDRPPADPTGVGARADARPPRQERQARRWPSTRRASTRTSRTSTATTCPSRRTGSRGGTCRTTTTTASSSTTRGSRASRPSRRSSASSTRVTSTCCVPAPVHHARLHAGPRPPHHSPRRRDHVHDDRHARTEHRAA